MSTTPALERAAEALAADDDDRVGRYHRTVSRVVVSAALHDPDDPESLWLYGAAVDAAAASLGTTLLTESYIVAVRSAVDAVRSAILGEVA